MPSCQSPVPAISARSCPLSPISEEEEVQNGNRQSPIEKAFNPMSMYCRRGSFCSEKTTTEEQEERPNWTLVNCGISMMVHPSQRHVRCGGSGSVSTRLLPPPASAAHRLFVSTEQTYCEASRLEEREWDSIRQVAASSLRWRETTRTRRLVAGKQTRIARE